MDQVRTCWRLDLVILHKDHRIVAFLHFSWHTEHTVEWLSYTLDTLSVSSFISSAKDRNQKTCHFGLKCVCKEESRCWPSHCQSRARGWKCQLSPVEIVSNHNEDFVAAVKCASTDRTYWNLPLAFRGCGSPDKTLISLWKIIPYLMELVLYETAGPYVEEFTRRAGVDSTRTSANHTWFII